MQVTAPEFLTTQEAAKFLKVSPLKIYELVSHGELTHFRPNPTGKIYLKQSDLIKFIESGKKAAHKKAG